MLRDSISREWKARVNISSASVSFCCASKSTENCSSVLGGTCRHANLPGLELCGKTGTAQNPHGPDHSVFMGFAPMNDPKIAVAVYVENGGWGATFGVPIGSLMIEKYLNGKVARTDLASRMMNTSVLGRAGRQPGSKTKAKSVNKTNNESSQATATQESSNGVKTE